MIPSDFCRRWKHSPMIKFRLSSPSAAGLSPATAAALREYGLPGTAEPWLSFMEFAAMDRQVSSAFEMRGLFPVGSLASGSFICIEKKSDRLVIFNPIDPDENWLLNSSLDALFECIFQYDAFIREVNRRNPNYSSDFRIPEGMLSELANKLTACDPDAISSQGFWHCELKALDDSILL